MNLYFYPCCHGSHGGLYRDLIAVACIENPHHRMSSLQVRLVSPVSPVFTPLKINLLMLENSSLLCPLQLRWHFILIQDPKWMVAACALAGRQWYGGLGQHKTFSPLATIYPRFIDNLCAHTHTHTHIQTHSTHSLLRIL